MSWSLSIKTPFLIDLQEFFIYSGDGSSVGYSQFSIFSKSCSMWSPGTLTQLSWIIVFSPTRAHCCWLGHTDPAGSTIVWPGRSPPGTGAPQWGPSGLLHAGHWVQQALGRGHENRKVTPRSTRAETRTTGAGRRLLWKWGEHCSRGSAHVHLRCPRWPPSADGADKRGLASRRARRDRTWECWEGPCLHPPLTWLALQPLSGERSSVFPSRPVISLCLLGRASASCLSTAHTEAEKCPRPRKRAVGGRHGAYRQMADK